MYLGGVINPLTLTIKRLIAAIPKIIKIIPAAFLILASLQMILSPHSQVDISYWKYEEQSIHLLTVFDFLASPTLSG